MGEAIKAALREAALVACSCECDLPQPGCLAQVAEEIATFLRALPTAWVRDTYGSDEAVFKNLLHEAVTNAAQEGGR